ncbi:MAG: hypothetical protein KatS3mg067_0410 [Thermosynechococcus sp.]|nr:MAG: hypothetical protein KatS3mg067_0410 [Thermosynechococcus sp.]
MPLILSVGLFQSDRYFHPEHQHSEHDHNHDHDHECDEHCDHDHHHHPHHSNHLEEDGFTSVSFQSDRPFELRKFQYFLDHQLPQSVFRAKGILWFKESPRRHVFHLSGKRFSLDDEEWKGDRKNQLVLIGQNLDHATLLNQLAACVTDA